MTAPPPAAEPLLTLKLRGFAIVPEPSANRPAPASIELLTHGLAAGEEEAFRQFHRLYFDRLYRYLLAVARGEEEAARDALQETLVRVVRSARAFSSEEVFWCWLKAVGRNAARDAGRKRLRHLDLLRRFALDRRAPTADPGEGAVDAALQECLDELPPEDRSLVEAKYLHGETIHELSTGMGTTEKAVESRLLRLRRRLREQIMHKLRER